MSYMQRLGLVAVITGTSFLGGCGEAEPARYNVSGKVTYKGQPLPAGIIFFDPDAGKGHDGPQGFAYIKDGRYDTTETERGPIGGPHIVRIDGFDGQPGEELPMGKPVFKGHQQSIELPLETTTYDFHISGT